jgi:hypothetical protein
MPLSRFAELSAFYYYYYSTTPEIVEFHENC